MNTDEFLKRELSRRRFLENSARNAAGVAAGIVGLGGAALGSGSPAERLNVALIGLRTQGKELALALAGLPDVRVAALCDVDEAVLAETRTLLADRQPAAMAITGRMTSTRAASVVTTRPL